MRMRVEDRRRLKTKHERAQTLTASDFPRLPGLNLPGPSRDIRQDVERSVFIHTLEGAIESSTPFSNWGPGMNTQVHDNQPEKMDTTGDTIDKQTMGNPTLSGTEGQVDEARKRHRNRSPSAMDALDRIEMAMDDNAADTTDTRR